MANVIRSRVHFMNERTNTTSAPVSIDSIQSSVVAQITGTGTISATLNVYSGVWDYVAQDWAIKTLDATINLSSTNGFDSGRVDLTTISTAVQFEITNITGTNAAVSAGLIQTNEGQI